MTSDLPGGLQPDELDGVGSGADRPGLEQLLRALTSDGTAAELAGEQAALAMFRAHGPAPAGSPSTASVATATGALGAPTRTEPSRVQPADGAAGGDSGGRGDGRPPRRWRRVSRASGGVPRLRVAILAATALVGAFAVAAYLAVLPAPVQHVVYQAFHEIGVPDTAPHHTSGSGGPGGSRHTTGPAGRHRHGSSPSSQPHPTPSVSGPRAGTPPSASPTSTPHPSGSPASPSVSPTGSGPVVLSAQAASPDIPAGTSATINGMLTEGSVPASGVAVRLMEHVVGVPGWLAVGRAQTNAQGDVSFTTPVLRRNAWFRIAAAGGTKSTVVVITVLPSISATLRPGAGGIKDYITVTTTYARTGDVVLLQVLQNGTWVTIKQGVLNAKRRVTIAISATRRQGEEIQAVLLATKVHGEATSAPLTVPAPG